MSSVMMKAELDYPTGDGQPMAETGIHVMAIIWLHQALEDFFRDQPEVYIASDQFWYWEEGNPNAVVAPDVMVVPGVGNRVRPCFFAWQENAAVPAAVFEMASKSTWKDDLNDKFDQYERLGVREYFLFDPEGVYLVPQLQGYKLNGSAYRRMRQGSIESELGFRLQAEGTMLRLLDARTGEPILTRAEQVQRANSRADALAVEVERLKKLLGENSP